MCIVGSESNSVEVCLKSCWFMHFEDVGSQTLWPHFLRPPGKVTPENERQLNTSGYATWFTAGGAIRISHYDVINDVITRKL